MATRVDYTAMKARIKTLLDTENTTTASVLDLSDSLSKRVSTVNILNPEVLDVNVVQFPAICIWMDRKTIERQTIARTQVEGMRKSDSRMYICGIVSNPNFIGNPRTDPADIDCEQLMENIEYILRSDETLNGTCKNTFPFDVTYQVSPIREDSHVRVGVLELEIINFY